MSTRADHTAIASLIRELLHLADEGALTDVALHLNAALVACDGAGVPPPRSKICGEFDNCEVFSGDAQQIESI